MSVISNDCYYYPDEHRDMQGHRLRIVTMPFFPYIDYQRDSEEDPGTTVTPKDSTDVRLIKALAKSFNFT